MIDYSYLITLASDRRLDSETGAAVKNYFLFSIRDRYTLAPVLSNR
jgi:hypothetical protein